MREQDAVEQLQLLGMKPNEARIYVHLSMKGPTKASDVAAGLRMRRTEAYRVLQELVQKGAVRQTLERPVRFEATLPSQVFDDAFAIQEKRWEKLAEIREDLVGLLATLRARSQPELPRRGFKVLQGRPEVYGTLERMVRQARQKVQMMTTHPDELGLAERAGLWDLVLRRAIEGLSVQILTANESDARAALGRFTGAPSIEIRRVLEERRIRLVIADGKEIILWAVTAPSNRIQAHEEVALWTDADEMTESLVALWERFHRDAVPLGPEIATARPRR